MIVSAKSDVGKAREMNQDYYYASDPMSATKLYILADGMGGYKGGEVASSLAVNTVKRYILNNIENIEKEKEEIMQLIASAIEYANMVVFEEAQKNPELKEMGTTIDVCLIYSNKIFIGHVGDSRVYRIRKNIIRKLTTDHSYVEKLVREGTITKEEAYNHPKKNMLTKALGCNTLVEPDVAYKGFLKDDQLLMCSDGLTNMIKDDEIYKILKNNPDEAAEILVNRANMQGGYDNITVIVLNNF